MEDIAGLINDKFVDRMGRVQCGIVYCLSKADCEKVAEQLQSAVDSLPYQQGRKVRCKIKYVCLEDQQTLFTAVVTASRCKVVINHGEQHDHYDSDRAVHEVLAASR